MTAAYILVPGAGPSAVAPSVVERLASDLAEQLEAAGAGPVIVAEAAVDRLLEVLDRFADDDDVVLVDGRLVAHGSVFRLLLRGSGARILVRVDEDGDAGVEVEGGTAVAVQTPLHGPVGGGRHSVGALRLSGEEAGEVARLLAHAPASNAAVDDAVRAAPVETVAGLVLEAGVRVDALDVRGLVARRVSEPDDVEAALAERESSDEDHVWLDAAVKPWDSWVATFLVSPYSRLWARWAARRGMPPGQVTALSLVVGLVAAVLFAVEDRGAAISAAGLLFLSFVLDCVDGQLARYTGQTSRFGAWFDAMADRIKEYLVYLGLAVGAGSGAVDIWVLAAAATGLQTVRHMVYLSFDAAQPPPRPRQPAREVEAATEPAAKADQAASPWTESAEGFVERNAIVRWLRRIVVLPVGERIVLIGLAAVLTTPRITFLILLAWGGVAGLVTLAGRAGRARSWPRARWSWLRPPFERVVEHAVLVGLGWLTDAGPAAFAAVLASALHHYDREHRAEVLGPPADRSAIGTLLAWWPLRIALLLVAWPMDLIEPALWIIAAVVLLLGIVEAAGAWRPTATPRPTILAGRGDRHG